MNSIAYCLLYIKEQGVPLKNLAYQNVFIQCVVGHPVCAIE